MHRSLVPLQQVATLKEQFGASRGMIDTRDGAAKLREKYVKSKVLQIYRDLEKETLPGILNFELAAKIAHKFLQNRQQEFSKSGSAIASKNWKLVQRLFDKIVDFKYLVNSSVEDIIVYGLANCVKMPSYKTIGIFDAVRASSIKKYEAVCARDRLLKFCKDDEGRTPLIKAVESSKVEFVREMLKHKQPIDHVDDYGKPALYYAIKRGEREIVEMLLLHRASFSDSKSCQYSSYLEEMGLSELCYFLQRVEHLLSSAASS